MRRHIVVSFLIDYTHPRIRVRKTLEKHRSSGILNGMETLIPFNGKFTIESPRGGHKTFQIKTAKNGGLKGKRILSLFQGSDNMDETQFKGFAFVNDRSINLWSRFKESKNHRVYVDMLISMIREGVESQYHQKGYRMMMEKKCRKCNRTLTNPESIKNGIGPECATR